LEEVEDAAITEVSLFPLQDHARATELALQQDQLRGLGQKSRLSFVDKQLKNLDRAYGGMLRANFARPASSGARGHLLPVAPATGNHRAVWLGGGGVGKTRTLSKVVEPMAITYFGEQGYLGKAQSKHAAHNLEPRARTMHSSSGPLMADPCRPPGCA
jgi:hypothetical protein